MTLVTPHAPVAPHPAGTTLRHPDLVAIGAVACALAAVGATALPVALICCPLLALVAVATGIASLGGSGHGHRLGRSMAAVGVALGGVVLVGSFAALLLLARFAL